MATKTILHLDMNSYFATCEQQANPFLRGKPLGIVKAVGRGCVIAASIEAKKFGVKTGITTTEAKKLCPGILFVPADMEKYFSITKGMIQIIEEFSPTVEVFSIDECFADITDTQELWPGGAMQIALELKNKIKRELGDYLKCSIGISFSKLLAKLASEMKKPDGLVFLTEDNYLTATKDLPVSEVCGIGYARTAYLHGRGAYTLQQARLLDDLPEEYLPLVWLTLDMPLTTVEELDPAKSVSRTFTTFKTITTEDEIKNLVRNLVEEATAKLREMQMAGRTFSLSLRSGNPYINGQETESFWCRRTIHTATCDPLDIFSYLWSEYVSRPLQSVRFAGVHISQLEFHYQLHIYPNRPKLLAATDSVNEKWGLFTIYPATLLKGELIRPEVTGFLGDKYYRLKAISGS